MAPVPLAQNLLAGGGHVVGTLDVVIATGLILVLP
jgi:hypothetical protein